MAWGWACDTGLGVGDCLRVALVVIAWSSSSHVTLLARPLGGAVGVWMLMIVSMVAAAQLSLPDKVR